MQINNVNFQFYSVLVMLFFKIKNKMSDIHLMKGTDTSVVPSRKYLGGGEALR